MTTTHSPSSAQSVNVAPCPFCGSTNVATELDEMQGTKWGFAACECSARGPEVRTAYNTRPDAPWRQNALAAWNDRVAASAQAPIPEGWHLVPDTMTAAMINAWSGGTAVTSDEVAARTPFQDAWKRVLSATPPSPDAREAGGGVNGHDIEKLFLTWSEWTTELGEAISRKNIDGFVSDLFALSKDQTK